MMQRLHTDLLDGEQELLRTLGGASRSGGFVPLATVALPDHLANVAADSSSTPDSRTAGRIQPQSWNGAEAASVIPDVPKPGWLQSATWRDPAGTRVWRAEEMELVTELAIAGTGAMITIDPRTTRPT
jgi:hypothetical protein